MENNVTVVKIVMIQKPLRTSGLKQIHELILLKEHKCTKG